MTVGNYKRRARFSRTKDFRERLRTVDGQGFLARDLHKLSQQRAERLM